MYAEGGAKVDLPEGRYLKVGCGESIVLNETHFNSFAIYDPRDDLVFNFTGLFENAEETKEFCNI